MCINHDPVMTLTDFTARSTYSGLMANSSFLPFPRRNLSTADCKNLRRKCVKYKSQRGISPVFAAKFRSGIRQNKSNCLYA